MKTFIIIVIFIFLNIGLLAQSCLPEGITFSSQAQIDSFQFNYPGCKKIIGDVKINGDDITNLNGLIGLTSTGGLRIIDNCSLLNLSGLDNLTSVGGSVQIGGNPLLSNINGLINLKYIPGNLEIGTWYAQNFHGNPSLKNLAGLDNLDSIGGSFDIFLNSSLYEIIALGNLRKIGADLRIGDGGGNPSLKSLTGMGNLVSIGGNLEVCFNDSLINFEGMESLESIGGSLRLGRKGTGSTASGGNLSLINLEGLNNLSSIGGNLEIYFNASLTSLTGLENLASIGGSLLIGGYFGLNGGGNPSLVSLNALENLSSVSGDIGIFSNDLLTSLTGLENIAPGSISNLWILENPLLSSCEVQSICDYLVNAQREVVIFSNAPGCNTPEEVKQACDSLPVPEISRSCHLLIHPNPFTEAAMISFELDAPAAIEVVIYDKLGKVVMKFPLQEYHSGAHSVTWQAKGMPAGIYLIRFQAGADSITTKIDKL
jgi:hypothetical protein